MAIAAGKPLTGTRTGTGSKDALEKIKMLPDGSRSVLHGTINGLITP